MVSVRLATGVVARTKKIEVDLRVAFNDFDSIESFTVLDMDGRFDLILGMPWLERHEPWIDWRTKSVGSSSPGRSEDQVRHEPSFAHQQVNSITSDGTEMYFVGVVNTTESSKDAPLTPSVELAPLVPSMSHAASATIADTAPGGSVEVSLLPRVGSKSTVGRRRRRRKLRVRFASPLVSQVIPALNVIDAVTGATVDTSTMDLAPLPEFSELTSLEELSMDDFAQELKAGEIAEVVILRSERELAELNTSSVIDESVMIEFRQKFDARRGSTILKNPKDRYYPLVKRFADTCLSKDPPTGLPPDRGIRHEIKLKPGSSYATVRQWALPAEQSDFIDEFFAKKLKDGLVRESVSPHSAPTFCVRKPNGKWRIVHAYNKLNAQTVPAQTPIPRKDVIIHRMAGAKKLSSLDLIDGYYQVLMELADIPKTAVSTPSGMLWEWLVMPQGLSNAPATFNRLVTHLFRPLRAFAQTYFDDIYVHTKPETGRDLDSLHEEHLRQVLECLEEHKLYANLDKCIFGADEIPVLGCFVGVDGVRADPEKIKAIAEWPSPQSVKDLRKWLGLANYLHRFTKNYAEMARPLTQLLKNDAEWSWSAETEAAFQRIKSSLLEAPVLALPDDSKPYSVVCDASDFAIGCALLQQDDEGHERVVSYQSRQLQAAEKNYPVHDKELLAMKYALVKFRVHLLGSLPFVVYTDHASLRTATKSPHLSPRMARWLSFFSEYNFSVEYKPGRLNVLADALSRRPDYEMNHLTSIASDVYELIRDAYGDDAQCLVILRALQSAEAVTSLSPRVRARLHRYSVQDGLLMYQVTPGEDGRVVVPADEDLRYVIAYGVHDAPGAGHLGREKTYSLLSPRFWWPKMYKWVSRYVRTCDVCQRVKPSPHSQAPLQSLPVPSDCWRSVSMDFFFGLPRTAAGHNGVLVFVDRLSKMVHLAPVSDTCTGSDCARLFVDEVFRLHGLPDSIVSDRDPRFTGDFWEGLFRILGTRLDMSTTDHPETDGQTERANRVVEDILRSYCAEHPDSWSATLPMVEFAMNNAVHASTGLSPFYVNGLRHPALPLCLMGGSQSGEGGARQLLASQLDGVPKKAERQKLDDFLSTRVSVVTRVRDAMAQAQDVQKEHADKNGRKNTSVFKEGDYVLVSTKNLSSQAVSSLGSTKLLPRYIGPFKVLKKTGNSYRVDLPSWMQTHPTFYVGLLKPYLRPDEADDSGNEDDGNGRAQVERAPRAMRDSSHAPSESYGTTGMSAVPPSADLRMDADDSLSPATQGQQPRAQLDAPSEITRSDARRRSPRLREVMRRAAADSGPFEGTSAPAEQTLVVGTQPGQAAGKRAIPSVVLAAKPPATKSRTKRKAQRPVRAPPPVLDRHGNRHYHVEAIEGVRTLAGVRQLRVKWLGYPRTQSSWVDEPVLREDCADLVRACEQDHPGWFQ